MTTAQREGLRASGINIAFGGVKALNEVHLELDPGVWTGLIGPNGSGKTTLLNVLSGVYRPQSGRLLLDGRDLGTAGVSGRSRAGIVRTFQHPQLAATLTLEENIRLGLDLRARRGLGSLGRKQAQQAVDEQLERFGCAPFARHLPAQAPYGARKMAELARAAVAKPAVLLLDEPAAGLSREERKELVDALHSIQRSEPELAACLVEHDVRLVAAVCPRMQALNFGKVIAAGLSEQVLADPEVREAYLGRGDKRDAEVSQS